MEKLRRNGLSDLFIKYRIIKNWIILQENGSPNEDLGKYDPDTAETEICKNLVEQDLALVTIMFEKKKYVRTIKNIRMTFTDKLGAFGNIFSIIKESNLFQIHILGGTLGLFTGMSILGMFEIAFWLMRIPLRFCEKGKKYGNGELNDKVQPSAQ